MGPMAQTRLPYQRTHLNPDALDGPVRMTIDMCGTAIPEDGHDGSSRRLRLVVAALVVAATGSCSHCHHPPAVTAVAVVPPLVYAGRNATQTATFELEARIWTGALSDRHRMADSARIADLQWSSSQPWLVLVRQHDDRALFSIANSFPGDGAEAIVTARIGSTSGTARLVMVTPGKAEGNDTLVGPYTDDLPPASVVVNGVRSSGESCTVSMVGFVRASILGQLQAPCPSPAAPWGIALLGVDQAVTLEKYDWTASDDAVDRSAAKEPVRELPVAVWIAIGPNALEPEEDAGTLRQEVMDVALADLELADTLFLRSRAGIGFYLADSTTITSPQTLAAIGNDCFAANALSTHYEPGVINLYYVRELADMRGVECGSQRTAQNAIYLAWKAHSATTLTHELGHLLSLTLPRDGHTDALPGFDLTNVMASGLSDADARGREEFTTGQVFRMNADSASWLNWARTNGHLVREASAPRLACQCRLDDSAPPCPTLVSDLAPPSERVGEFNRWECSDELHLKGTGGSDSAVGLLAGRRWRSPDRCSTDLPAKLDRHFGDEVRLQVANLTHPGDCPSWAAIFFRQRGIMYLELVDQSDTAWTDIRNERLVFDRIPERYQLPVHVRYLQAGLKDHAVSDTIAAAQAFGVANRSGIALVFDLAQGSAPDACPEHPGAGPDVRVSYPSPGHITVASCIGGTLRAFDLPVANDYPSTTVAHYVGRTLGLEDVEGTDFKDNLMQHESTARGTTLTLGQVFRINVSLSLIAGIDTCNGAGQCPSLGADLRP